MCKINVYFQCRFSMSAGGGSTQKFNGKTYFFNCAGGKTRCKIKEKVNGNNRKNPGIGGCFYVLRCARVSCLVVLDGEEVNDLNSVCSNVGRHSCRRLVWSAMVMCVHFVGFPGEEFHNAVKVWRMPDFFHRVHDRRAVAEFMEGDTVVFARGTERQFSVWTFDDSREFQKIPSNQQVRWGPGLV